MRFAVFSDPHADLAATERVLARAEQQACERVICLGDVVGYGDAPGPVIDLLRRHRVLTLRGNHDAAIFDTDVEAELNDRAREVIARHRAQLTDEQLAWLAGLPLEARVDRFAFSHASLPEPERFRYLTFSRADAAEEPDIFVHVVDAGDCLAPGEVLFVGHRHVPAILTERNGRQYKREFPVLDSYPLGRPGRRTIVEVGSPSVPRRGRPTFVLADTEERVLRFIRLAG